MWRLVLMLFIVSLTKCFATKTEEKCTEYSLLFQDKIEVSHIWDGPRSSLGKELTSPGEFPHMAFLGYGKDDDLKWQCGGVLISDQYILTTAVCTNSPQKGLVRKVRLGVYSVKSNQNVQEYTVAEIIPHPDYKAPLIYNDILLLKLDKPVKFTKSIRPACLSDRSSVNTNTAISATGWGLLDVGGVSSEELMKVYLDPFTIEECKTAYEEITRKIPNGIDEKTQICLGGKNSAKDTCQGDSGGPVQILGKNINMYEIIGLTSFGKSCGNIGVPAVYTKVSSYVPWIEKIVWP